MITGLMKCSLPACIWSGFLGCAGFKAAFVEGALIGPSAARRRVNQIARQEPLVIAGIA